MELAMPMSVYSTTGATINDEFYVIGGADLEAGSGLIFKYDAQLKEWTDTIDLGAEIKEYFHIPINS